MPGHIRARHGSRPWRFVVTLAAAGLVSTFAVACSDDSESIRPIARGVATVLPPAPGLHVVGSVPLALVPDATAWSGAALLAFGRIDATIGAANIGASYVPDFGTWTKWPRAPFVQPLSGVAGVWSGTELILVGVACDNRAEEQAEDPDCVPGTLDAAAFAPSSRTWRRLPAPPAAPQKRNSGAFGSAIGWTGTDAVFQVGSHLWAFAPASARWRQLADPRTPLGHSCIAGGRVVSTAQHEGDPVFRGSVSNAALTEWTTHSIRSSRCAWATRCSSIREGSTGCGRSRSAALRGRHNPSLQSTSRARGHPSVSRPRSSRQCRS